MQATTEVFQICGHFTAPATDAPVGAGWFGGGAGAGWSGAGAGACDSVTSRASNMMPG